MVDVRHYAYRVQWSADDNEYVATVAEFPSLSWLDAEQAEALRGLAALVSEVVSDTQADESLTKAFPSAPSNTKIGEPQ